MHRVPYLSNMRRELFTIGHSSHSIGNFLQLLKKHQVDAVCDVRSVPYSRHNPQFNREALKQELQGAGLSYVFLGKELGARSTNPDCYVEGKVQYKCLAQQPTFGEGLARLNKGIDRFRVAIMCAEADPLTCHRTILVCRELRSSDLEIEHIRADGSIETNCAAEKRLMSMMDIEPDMFHSERDCIEQAYDKQAAAIAYVADRMNLQVERGIPADEDFHHRLHE
jgi:uncharacterized protein (DUF488 family)